MRAIPIDRFLENDEQQGGGAAYDWRRLVAEGRAARKAADGGSWRIGDLASMVERRYRSGALKRFAEEIGESLGSVRRFRWVAEAYDARARAAFPDLSFSHFQAVAALEDRIIWLGRAHHGTWSVDRLTTQSRDGEDASSSAEVRLRRPIDSAMKQLSKLMDVDDRDLITAARHGLVDAVEELVQQVEALREKVRKASTRRRTLKLAPYHVGTARPAARKTTAAKR